LTTTQADLATAIGSVTLPNPVMTASGTAGHGAELAGYVDLGRLGAVVVKSLAAYPWAGNPPPRIAPIESGMINSVGLAGPGVEAWLDEELPELLATGARVVVSIWGRTVEDYRRAAELLADAPSGVIAVEVNVSCPNVEDRHAMFAHSPEATAAVIEATEACDRPRWAKLSPNVSNLVEIAGAAHEAGAEAVTLVNTLMGLALDPETGRALLGNGGGGVSGAGLRPIAVRAVYECRERYPDLPIIGVGGITKGADAVEFLLAGAQGIQVGTATFANPRAVAMVLDELTQWCEQHRTTTAWLIGRAHR